MLTLMVMLYQYATGQHGKNECTPRRWKAGAAVLRGALLNRTYGKHKHLYISLFLLTIFGPIYLKSPVILNISKKGDKADSGNFRRKRYEAR